MPNPKHLQILKQRAKAWNRWRKNNPDVMPNLRGADLFKEDLRRLNLFGADLSKANLSKANLSKVNLSETDLRGANLSEAKLKEANFGGANLFRVDLRKSNLFGANLSKANLSKANLFGANLSKVNLSEANLSRTSFLSANLFGSDLRGANLYGADMISTDLTNTNITGAFLYGTARDNWKIDGITCNYIYFDEEGNERTPKDRDFRPGEFEELYRTLPTIDYYFENGFTPVDAVIMDKVVQAINQKNPEYHLEMVSFDKRGTPHATFTVLQKEVVEQVRQQIAADYETRMKVLEGQKDQLMEVISMLSSRPSIIADTIHNINQTKSIGRIEQHHGDKTDIRADGDASYAKDRAKASIVKADSTPIADDDNGLKE